MKSSIFRRSIWLIRHRPSQFWDKASEYLLFHYSKLMRTIFPIIGVTLEDNVRIQRNSSLVVEYPSAHIMIGANSIIYEDAKIEAYSDATIEIGKSSIIGPVRIYSRHQIKIGDRFLSSWNIFIQDYDPHPTERALRSRQVESIVEKFQPSFIKLNQHDDSKTNLDLSLQEWNFPGEAIIIGSDVWIGANVTILKGAKIGDGCIVASGSVVLKGDYPAQSLIAGNPAKVVKEIL